MGDLLVKGQKDICGACGEVEDFEVLALGEVFGDLLAPGNVAAEGEESIEEVVSVCDTVKHLVGVGSGWGIGVMLVHGIRSFGGVSSVLGSGVILIFRGGDLQGLTGNAMGILWIVCKVCLTLSHWQCQ